jgi:hypothetical protein
MARACATRGRYLKISAGEMELEAARADEGLCT